jgi:hypothetical protein
MRINVYAEELTDEVEIVEKRAENTGRRFFGVRVFLKSPEDLHSTPQDDDRSAITFWVPWTRREGYDVDLLRDIARAMTVATGDIMDRIEEYRQQVGQ